MTCNESSRELPRFSSDAIANAQALFGRLAVTEVPGTHYDAKTLQQLTDIATSPLATEMLLTSYIDQQLSWAERCTFDGFPNIAQELIETTQNPIRLIYEKAGTMSLL